MRTPVATLGLCLGATCLAFAAGCGASKKAELQGHGAVAPQQPAVNSTNLREEVAALISMGDSVQIRRQIQLVCALVDQLNREGKDDDALQYLQVLLQHDSWALEYQMLYAEMLEKRGQPDVAKERARLVETYAENDVMISRARAFLKEPSCESPPALSKLAGSTCTIVLVPIGITDVCFLQELRSALETGLRIPVHVQQADVRIPPFSRDPLKEYIGRMRESLLANMEKSARLVVFLRNNKIHRDTLEEDDAVLNAVRLICANDGGTNALAGFNATLEEVGRIDKQWDIEKLMNNLHSETTPYWRIGVRYLGVTKLDAYSGASNYIFGSAEPGGNNAVITYHRFTAEFNGETPNRDRLLKRTLKQALSSIGFMLGVVRCSDPTCARAYPHNMAEHDAKSEHLCAACKAGFEKATGVVPAF